MRKVALGLALSGVLVTQTHAVGLGEIRTHSALNQPLSANIELVETSAGDIDDLQVALAPREVFEQVGISRSRLLDQLDFIPTVENGVPTIKVVSLQPIQEPFLNFVLEVTWANGKLLREYTVLLDPPVFSDTQYAGSAAPAEVFTPEMGAEELMPATDMAVLPPVVETLPPLTSEMPVLSETDMLQGGSDPFVAVPESPSYDAATTISESEAFLYEGLETYPVEEIVGLPEPVVLSEADIAAELSAPISGEGFDPFVTAGALPDPEVITSGVASSEMTYDDYPIEETFSIDDTSVSVAEAGVDQIFVGESELTPAEAEIESIFTETDAAAIAAVPSQSLAGDSYKVRRGDTLSRIARDVGTPGALNKTMVALLRENPSAFIDNNMNLVRAGYILRIPDAQTVNGITESEALSIIASQNSAWKQYRASVASVATPQIESSGFAGIADLENRIITESGSSTIVREESAAEEVGIESLAAAESELADVNDLIKPPSELTILVPDEQGDSIEGVDSTGTGAIGNLEGELSLAKEQLESQSQQNTELRSRVNELESLLESKNRLIELKNEQLAEFQEQLTIEASDGSESASSVADEAKELASSAVSGVQDSAKGLLPDSDNEAVDTAEPDEKPVEKGSSTSVKEPEIKQADRLDEEPGMFDALKDNPNLLMGAGVGGLLLAALGWLLLRRKDEDEVVDAIETPLSAAAAPLEEVKDEVEPSAAAAVAEVEDKELLTLDDVQDEMGSEEEGLLSLDEESELPSDTAMGDESVDGDEDEVMSEANVYLAYGLQDQAIDLLKPVVESSPERTDYAMKLAESYHAADEKQAFSELAATLKDRVGEDSEEWQKLSAWGKDLVPDDSIFGSVGKATAGIAATGAAAVGGVGAALGAAKENVTDSLPDSLPDIDLNDPLEDLVSETDLADLSEEAVDEVSVIDLSELDDFEVGLKDEANDLTDTLDDGLSTNLSSEDELDLDGISLDEQDSVLATSEIEDDSIGLGPASTMALEIEDDLDLDTLVGDDESLSVFSAGEDEVSTKLDLAKAYLDMGDDEGAREALEEVINIGNDGQREEAKKLKAQLDT